jgi:hypothetical protein
MNNQLAIEEQRLQYDLFRTINVTCFDKCKRTFYQDAMAESDKTCLSNCAKMYLDALNVATLIYNDKKEQIPK